jgi:hypothetical protein
MERREALGLLGVMGAGLAGSAAGADHGTPAQNAGAANRYMAPVGNTHAHFCGIHIGKRDPKLQMIVQHYCAPLGDEMHQCLLFDSFERNAKLIGIEYIVSDRLYRQLSDDEKKYWHPHTYEVLAGGLIAPGMRSADEMRFMKAIINTWGKTWHTWPDPRSAVPLGEPMLMWAVTGDGQVRRDVVAQRDRMFNVDAERIRQDRVQEFGLEVPRVSLPRSYESIGRQWTDEGEDRPTRRP